MSTVAELRALLGAGEPLQALTEAAMRLLSDPRSEAGEPSEPATAFAALQTEWAELTALTSAAWNRYPEFLDSGAHGMRPDPRAIELCATLSYLARAGMYRPEELATMLQQSDSSGPWVAREVSRLRILLVCLTRLMQDLDSGALSPFSYAGAVRDLATRIGRAKVVAPSPPDSDQPSV